MRGPRVHVLDRGGRFRARQARAGYRAAGTPECVLRIGTAAGETGDTKVNTPARACGTTEWITNLACRTFRTSDGEPAATTRLGDSG